MTTLEEFAVVLFELLGNYPWPIEEGDGLYRALVTVIGSYAKTGDLNQIDFFALSAPFTFLRRPAALAMGYYRYIPYGFKGTANEVISSLNGLWPPRQTFTEFAGAEGFDVLAFSLAFRPGRFFAVGATLQQFFGSGRLHLYSELRGRQLHEDLIESVRGRNVILGALFSPFRWLRLGAAWHAGLESRFDSTRLTWEVNAKGEALPDALKTSGAAKPHLEQHIVEDPKLKVVTDRLAHYQQVETYTTLVEWMKDCTRYECETALQVEHMVNASGPNNGQVLLKDGSAPRAVGIIHCVGSRDKNTHEYCSRVCCMYSLKLAHLVHERSGAKIYNFYIDMRSAGKGYEEFYNHLLEEGCEFIRGRVAEVSDWAVTPMEKDKLVIRVEDTLVGVVRRIPMLVEHEGQIYESLSLAVVRSVLDMPRLVPGFAGEQAQGYGGLEWLTVESAQGGLTIPVDAEVSALIPYSGKRNTL